MRLLLLLLCITQGWTYSSIVEKIKHSNVGIAVKVGKYKPTIQTAGSGFIIDHKKGLVMTCAHVLPEWDGQNNEVYVQLYDGRTVEATTEYYFYTRDIAILRMKEGVGLKLPLPENYEVRFRSSSAVRLGEKVLTMGNPRGMRNTVGSGLVASLDKIIQLKAPNLYDNIIMIDTFVYGGSSGGPLFDRKGNVIGMVFGMSDATRHGFVIPSDILVYVRDCLTENVKPKLPFLGAQVRNPTIEDASKHHGIKVLYSGFFGVVVEDVLKNSPVDDKLEKNDLIYKINNRKFRSYGQFRNYLQLYADQEVSLDVLRKGKKVKLKVKPIDVYEDFRHDEMKITDPQTENIMELMYRGKVDKAEELKKNYSLDRIEIHSKRKPKNKFVELYRRVLLSLKRLI
jgi:serine protease Do